MTIRSRSETVTFKHPFRIRGIDRLLPAGAYEVVTDEETIEGLSFEAFRRVATMIKVPAEGSRGPTRNASTRAHPMADEPLDLDSRRGMAAQKATDIRSALAEVATHARELRERTGPR